MSATKDDIDVEFATNETSNRLPGPERARIEELSRQLQDVRIQLAEALQLNLALQAEVDDLASLVESGELAKRELRALRATLTLRTRAATLRLLRRA
ncbi:hypothetical protein [Nakamurella multipartita]|uniref:Uncharacterized protein n=1 Tax=Nakamurella multipartita (strain ATCC 700099 / DSM 44233 / CIP 104796 / JCM 9543 / NBRC 105858 / Y-104) TaxID=479431 RepID=C8XIN0_NAKMY|nr:hypothetical protein [Nakamurella multipartita]ACV80495.1 hypothetical protein Namu_4206 [Nakamurella multipartita DSM 44233]